MQRERNNQEKLSNLTELNQKDLHQQRQFLLDQTEKSVTLQRTLDVLKAELEQKEAGLKTRSLDLDNQENVIAEKLKMHKIQVENEVKNNFKLENQEIEDKNKNLNARFEELETLKSKLMTREVNLKDHESKHLETIQELKEVKEALKAQQIRNETLSLKLDNMQDYESVKAMNSLYKTQLNQVDEKDKASDLRWILRFLGLNFSYSKPGSQKSKTENLAYSTSTKNLTAKFPA